MKKKYQAAIIGAGKIGAFFDSPKNQKVLTHAHAYNNHPHFELAAFVDTDLKQAKRAAKIWGGRAYRNLSELFAHEKIDVVSVCVPDDLHYPILKQLQKSTISGGIVEKPFTTSPRHSREIISSAFYRQRPFLLNYTRRFVPEFQQIRHKIVAGEYGKLLSGSITHGKGLLHNGSHLIDLLTYFGFKIKKSQTISKVKDFYPDDWSYAAVLFLKDGATVVLNVVPASAYRVFEMDLFFERGRIKVLKDGFVIEEYRVTDDTIFKGYKILELKKTHQTDFGNALAHAVDNLYQVLIGKAEIACSLKNGYEVQKICNRIKHG